MLASLKTRNIGPSDLDLVFGKRLNLISGDNGLGKSFLLDLVWYALTRTWPNALNPRLKAGYPARPTDPARAKDARIDYQILKSGKKEDDTSKHARYEGVNEWGVKGSGAQPDPGLVFYFFPDGSCCLYDFQRSSADLPAYVLTQDELWGGMDRAKINFIKGLESDLVVWKKSTDEYDKKSLEMMVNILKCLSPRLGLSLGEPTVLDRHGIEEIPTINMPYQQNVPIRFVSSAIKRILSVAYFIAWGYNTHVKWCMANKGAKSISKKAVILFDEIDAHLHPKWQLSILPALMEVCGQLDSQFSVQYFVTTHSPLVMVSAETPWNDNNDSLIDIDHLGQSVSVKVKPFVKLGKAESYLNADQFDYTSNRSLEATAAIDAWKQASDAVLTMPKAEFEPLLKRLDQYVPKEDMMFWAGVTHVKSRRA